MLSHYKLKLYSRVMKAMGEGEPYEVSGQRRKHA